MTASVESLLDTLRGRNWRVEAAGEDQELGGLEQLVERYGPLPSNFVSFISSVVSCVNEDETAWFLVAGDYRGGGDSAYRWNEFEVESLKAAGEDAQWAEEIRSYWSRHLPILIAVKGGYAYLALRVRDGAVVMGREPEYEEGVVIATSFEDFAGRLADSTLLSEHPDLAEIL